MSKSTRNEPLGLQSAPARTSASSLPVSPFPILSRPTSRRQDLTKQEEKKKTANGAIILEPQPETSLNDPLNWPSWRRDIALISLGFYCMLGGGMTPVLAAGFNNVATSYNVSFPKVALTTGFYMMGLGLGSVIASPTAILFGKRPVYLVGIVLFLISAVWCALSPNYASLVAARIFMGIAVSPCECLPSATIAEIFFLHERAYRLGIYTLLLLGGKNLVPLVSAAIIQGLSWQWVFWIVAMVVGFCACLLFFFVPETFWDRSPQPKDRRHRTATMASISAIFNHGKKSTTTVNEYEHEHENERGGDAQTDMRRLALGQSAVASGTIAQRRQHKAGQHVGFAEDPATIQDRPVSTVTLQSPEFHDATSNLHSPVSPVHTVRNPTDAPETALQPPTPTSHNGIESGASEKQSLAHHDEAWKVQPKGGAPLTPALHNLNSPYYLSIDPYHNQPTAQYDEEGGLSSAMVEPPTARQEPLSALSHTSEKSMTPTPTSAGPTTASTSPGGHHYTHHLRTQPPKTFVQTLRPWNGRLRKDNWGLVAIRPFILFAYPSILWSTLVYSLSIGWLIVLSESVSTIYRNKESYNFSALGTGLVYISPFIGGILGTAVAGKLSDVIVRFMSRRNGGIYEPEFRLVMAIPVTIATCIGLMGFGWSAAERDKWIVPTVFFGIISFGCSLGSTTAITFAVDSYRQYAGEALVTLNFSKSMYLAAQILALVLLDRNSLADMP